MESSHYLLFCFLLALFLFLTGKQLIQPLRERIRSYSHSLFSYPIYPIINTVDTEKKIQTPFTPTHNTFIETIVNKDENQEKSILLPTSNQFSLVSILEAKEISITTNKEDSIHTIHTIRPKVEEKVQIRVTTIRPRKPKIRKQKSKTKKSTDFYWNQTNFYMSLGTAYVSVDSKVRNESISSSINYHTGDTLSCLTCSLPIEVDPSEKTYTPSTDWISKFDDLQKEVLDNYKKINQTRFDHHKKLHYSQVLVRYAIDSGSGWIDGTNLCYQYKTRTIHVFSPTGKPVNIRRYGKQFFRYGWNLEYHKGKVPKSKIVWDNDTGIYMGVAFRERHITHFAEGVNLLLLKLLAPSEFPSLNKLLLPIFHESTEYGWSKDYLKLLISSFPKEYQPTIIKRYELTTFLKKHHNPKYLCFSSIALMDRMSYNKDGGIFAGFFSIDWMRALSYKFANVVVNQTITENPIKLSILERHSDRKWYKLSNYLNAINKQFSDRLLIERMPLGGKSYAEQVLLFYNSDIVLGGHGSAMANAFFMRPGTVLIECNPPYFYEMCFANIAFISRVYYISVTNYNSTFIPAQLQHADALYKKGIFFIHRRKYAKYSIYPNVFSVLSAIEDAYELIIRNRYVFEVNDKWSRVFTN